MRALSDERIVAMCAREPKARARASSKGEVMRKHPLLFVLALLPSLVMGASRSEESVTWAKQLDKETIRRAALAHEADPLAPESRDKLAPILLAHFEDVPYVVCLDQVPGLTEEGTLGKALLWQMSFASGVYLEQHPEQAENREEYMLAGLESAVRAYRNVRVKNPDMTIAVLEELDRLEQRGGLREHIRAHSCVKTR